MTLVRFEPFRGFEKFGRKMNDLVSDIEKGVSFEMGGFNPRVDITEDDNHLFVHAELPGMSKDNVKVSIAEDRVLTLKGEKSRSNSTEDSNVVRNERIYGGFSRSFMLPENVDIEKVEAKFENGVLELQLNKVEPTKPREIEVTIS